MLIVNSLDSCLDNALIVGVGWTNARNPHFIRLGPRPKLPGGAHPPAVGAGLSLTRTLACREAG